MKTLKFKCTLLSDVVLNTKAATQGEQTTLNFIPGNNFLGIVANWYNRFSSEEQMEIFHSGHVRFGDGNPVNKGDKMRSLHVPATFFYPKGKKIWDHLYVGQGYSRSEDKQDNGKPMQLKQCRTGYYIFQNGTGAEVKTIKSFSQKSAYERTLRRSKDEQMYGYEALGKGQEYLFCVEVDNEVLANTIREALVGVHHIGSSRTAQYGQVIITEADFDEVQGSKQALETRNGIRVAVYADSRLIFLDDAGQPKTLIEAADLGLTGEIDWNFSQVRTFQYAPWNGKRQTRDADRYGVEKGSVFFVDCPNAPVTSAYIGSYRNEGFGHVIYNPDFLQWGSGNGLAKYRLKQFTLTDKVATKAAYLEGTPLLNFLGTKQKEQDAIENILQKVNEFVDKNEKKFKDADFASQWGKIRDIALKHPDRKMIYKELFEKLVSVKHSASPSNPVARTEIKNCGYLVHGVSAKKWAQSGRADSLKVFINDPNIDPAYIQQAVVNLASEMAKKCNRNEQY